MELDRNKLELKGVQKVGWDIEGRIVEGIIILYIETEINIDKYEQVCLNIT